MRYGDDHSRIGPGKTSAFSLRSWKRRGVRRSSRRSVQGSMLVALN
jgi:hypothetical protein